SPICSEVYDSEAVFGENVYVGHDEPSTLFYSNVAGSGNRMRYQLTLPKDPTPTAPQTPGKSYNFQLHPAFWFGMAMCDTQSFPEQVSTCAPDSDKNIVDPAVSPNHPGTAFMEMQFYPPGWVTWPAGNSCDATKWCAALNIDSLSENAVTGAAGACAGLTGIEYVNFAFITKSGTPQPSSPPNPLQSTINTFTPDPNADLFMNSGDTLTVTMHDTAHGLQIDIRDQTTHQSGSMTTSAANGFGQVPFSGACNNIPYDFHPMYSTSSEKTRVTWAAHSYNIAFADEIGHFDYCNGTNAITPGGTCPAGNTEGNAANVEPSDGDDAACFPASSSSLVQVPGCLATNTGFDGVPYTPVWPDGNTRLHPTSILFTSPLTGSQYNVNYSRMAFEADLPRIETAGASSSPNLCDRNTGAGCTLIPNTDDGNPAAFYPFFSIKNIGGGCVWQLGNHIPGSKNDFGQNAEYGTLLNSNYTAVGGGVTTRYNNFRQILSKNPCAANTN
ncbi:MAG TPA: hypothetical protein VFQ36_11385, partial [Ktedonobacteraceae bacterium]|nr:hypothetical protein [Ktedonobacteraceae bacterium]